LPFAWNASEHHRSIPEGFRVDIVTAWRTHHQWRDDFVFWVTREVSKCGSLCAYAHVLRELADALTPAEVVWLYERVRESRRPEFEWRGQFLALFPQAGPAGLPPPLVDEAEERRQAALARERSLRVYGRPGPCAADEDIPF
jgi:hypothetical protein